MAGVRIKIQNLKGLRDLDWEPGGLCAVIGANGSGKSTLLLALKFLHSALERGLVHAVAVTLGGSHHLRHHDAGDEPILFEIRSGALSWVLQLVPDGASAEVLLEQMWVGKQTIFERSGSRLRTDGGDSPAASAHRVAQQWVENTPPESAGESATVRPGEPVERGQRILEAKLAIAELLVARPDLEAVAEMASIIRSISVFHDLDTFALRESGSQSTQSSPLHSRGHNALTMLRAWSQTRPDRWRYAAVIDTMREAFPAIFEDLDFQEAGTTLAARVYRPGRETPGPLSAESNGLISMLISMCAVVAADEGGLVAIDEAGDAMHPFALRVFLRNAEQIAQRRQLTVVLASHNTVLIDHFRASPERVFVMGASGHPSLVALPALRSPQWLAQFELGELYADGELGSNADGVG